MADKEHILTRAEARKLVDRSARTGAVWCLSVRLDAAIVDKPDRCYQDGAANYLPLSRQQAHTLIGGLLTDTMESEKGARLRIRESQYSETSPVTYWITQ